VILRWYETLPTVGHDEDIDILFMSEDEPKFADLLQTSSPRPGSPKFDLYSEDGSKGSDFHGLPYYQSPLARQMLSTRKLYKDIYYVLEPKAGLFSLSYHVVFHKGSPHSGMQTTATSGAPGALAPRKRARWCVGDVWAMRFRLCGFVRAARCADAEARALLLTGRKADHDYASILAEMARSCGVNLHGGEGSSSSALTFERLHASLKDHGWAP
jgi:hypothetical protein